MIVYPLVAASHNGSVHSTARTAQESLPGTPLPVPGPLELPILRLSIYDWLEESADLGEGALEVFFHRDLSPVLERLPQPLEGSIPG